MRRAPSSYSARPRPCPSWSPPRGRSPCAGEVRRSGEVSGEVTGGHDRSPVAGEGVQEVPRAGVVHRAEVGALGAADVAPLALGGPLPTRHHVAPGAQCSS